MYQVKDQPTPSSTDEENVEDETISTSTIHPGRLLIPLKVNESSVKVFVPCGGPDPGTDRLPAWCKEYKINDVISIKPEQLRYKPGVSLMSAIAKQNYAVIMKNQVEEKRLYICKYMANTCKFMRPQSISILMLDLKFKNLKNNINKQKFSVLTKNSWFNY